MGGLAAGPAATRNRDVGPVTGGRDTLIGVDCIAGLPTTAAGFNMILNHIDLLSGVHPYRDDGDRCGHQSKMIR
jgi:hypothetical protein